MNRLFVRLVASGLATVTFGGGAALASDASIHLTGPGSTNVITSSSHGSYGHDYQSSGYRADFGNWKDYENDDCRDGGYGSYTKFFKTHHKVNDNKKYHKQNYGHEVSYVKKISYQHDYDKLDYNRHDYDKDKYDYDRHDYDKDKYDHDRHDYDMTDYDKYDYKKYDRDSNDYDRESYKPHHDYGGSYGGDSFTSDVSNNVTTTNVNRQVAETGDVRISGNTLVLGSVSSGDASNYNQARNDVSISNETPGVSSWSGSGSDNTASINLTGPGSYNAIYGGSYGGDRVDLSTTNNVRTSNSNYQDAQSGDVSVSHNTVVSGPISSGDATNWNTAQNTVDISNN